MNLKRLCKQCPTAANVYLYLLNEAGRNQTLFLMRTRQQIAKALGIGNENTITKAMKNLRAERGIKYRVGTKQKCGKTALRYYKISLGKDALSGLLLFVSPQGKDAVSALLPKPSSWGKDAVSASTLCKREASGTAIATPSPESATRTHATPEQLAAIFGTPKESAERA